MKKNEKNELPILDQVPSVRNSQQQYCRRSKRIAKMVKNKTNATSLSGNAIADSKSTEAIVGKGKAIISFAGNEACGGEGANIESKVPGVKQATIVVNTTTSSDTAIAANFTANATGAVDNAMTSFGKVKDTEVGSSPDTVHTFQGERNRVMR